MINGKSSQRLRVGALFLVQFLFVACGHTKSHGNGLAGVGTKTSEIGFADNERITFDAQTKRFVIGVVATAEDLNSALSHL